MNEQSHVSFFRGLHRGGTFLSFTIDSKTKCKHCFLLFFPKVGVLLRGTGPKDVGRSLSLSQLDLLCTT